MYSNTQSILLRAIPAMAVVLALAACDDKKKDSAPTYGNGTWPEIELEDGTLRLEVCTSDIVRVLFATSQTEAFFGRTTLAAAPKLCDDATAFEFEEGEAESVLTTDTLTVRVNMKSGAVRFFDAEGTAILEERGRSLEAVEIQDEKTFHVHQEWEPNDGEAFYGLGQHQQELMNIKDYPLSLVQYNTEIVVPMVVSSRGYGILWDNTSYTRWGDLQDFIPLNEDGGSISLDFTAEVTGDHIFQTWAAGGIELTVDGETVIEHFTQGWLPQREYAKLAMEEGETYALELSHTVNIGVNIAKLSVKPPATDPATSLWSNVGDGIDYYFVHGPKLDDVVKGYRRITGDAPMMPRWAYGMWQCRERYTSAEEVIEVLDGFRSRSIPIDNIVQDWQYWVPGTWGSHTFDAERFPDPEAWIDEIHNEYNAQLMISVWPKFHHGTDNFEALLDAGFVYEINIEEDIRDFMNQPMVYVDAFNADAREMYWSQMNDQLFSLGVDAWWMDATEPEVVEGPYESPESHRELYETHMHPTAMGSGSRMLNAFSLVNSQAVYEGQREEAADQRVFILTRSAFAGSQRYASASWSGDITTTWTAFKKQIPAGLSIALSGIPYWTTDIGGFSESPEMRIDTEQWAELNSRWYQYGTFTPLLRVHGQDDTTGDREMWNFDDDTYAAILKFDKLRYRLLPYIYSLAGAVTHDGYTMMRPLVMDFTGDASLLDIKDQFMFGPAFLVNPVTDYEAREREVVLPDTPGGWYDFWTGESEDGDETITAEAPYDAMPLYIRAGAIVPLGPELQYTGEAEWDPITLYVYAGADGEFTLYEDAGLDYGYEEGQFCQIPIAWNDAESTLSIGERKGSFPEMIEEHTFHIILVTAASPAGYDTASEPVTTTTYTGEAIQLPLDK